MNSGLTDEELKYFVMKAFNSYDRNGDGALQAPELAQFFRDLYKSIGYQVEITWPMAQQALKDIDQDGDGKISRQELFSAFKLMLSQPQIYLQNAVVIQAQKMDVQDCREWHWPDQN